MLSRREFWRTLDEFSLVWFTPPSSRRRWAFSRTRSRRGGTWVSTSPSAPSPQIPCCTLPWRGRPARSKILLARCGRWRGHLGTSTAACLKQTRQHIPSSEILLPKTIRACYGLEKSLISLVRSWTGLLCFGGVQRVLLSSLQRNWRPRRLIVKQWFLTTALHRLNLQVFSIKPQVFQMKKLAGFLKKQTFFSKNVSNLRLIWWIVEQIRPSQNVKASNSLEICD